jgi:hypothetical protein
MNLRQHKRMKLRRRPRRLIDWARNRKGWRQLSEMLNQTNEILADMTWTRTPGPVTVRVALPRIYVRT